MAIKIPVSKSTPSHIAEAKVFSNSGNEPVRLERGVFRLTYYESILQDTIQASFTFSDTGTNVNEGKNAVDGVPITGSEQFHLHFADNNGNELKFKDENALFVNDVTPLLNETTKSLTQLQLVSKEYILNEKVRINSRMDGSISDHVRQILTKDKYLATTKDVDIEETVGEINETPKNKKPFYILNELSRKGVSATNQKLGESAGYFFFETAKDDGMGSIFKFKSIDGLLAQDKKLSVIYTETTQRDKVLPQYDVKALDYTVNNLNNVQKKLAVGAYTSRLLTFNPFTFEFNVHNPQAFAFQDSGYEMGGENLPVLNEAFNPTANGKSKGDFSVTSLKIVGVGGLQTGNTESQLSKSKEIDFNLDQILNQSFMRYNNLFCAQVMITIPGDFSLHAGDVIFVDAPLLDKKKDNPEVNPQSGGLYIIADLAHYLTPNETYTRLNLVRDSFGRKGNPSS